MSFVGIYLIEKILETKQYDKLFKINPKWFTHDLEKRIYDIVMSAYNTYNSLPTSIKKLHIKEILPPDLFENYDTQVNADFYYGMLLNQYAEHLYQQIKSLKPFKTDSTGIKNFLKDIYQELDEYFNVEQKINTISYLSYEDIINETKKELKQFTINYAAGNFITTGYKYLDIMFGGGYVPCEVYVYVARLKMGKTMYLIKSALESLKKGKNILFVSMEMDFFQIMRRMLALFYKDKKYLTHMIITDNNQFHLQKIEKDFNKLNFQFNYFNGMSLNNVKQLETYIDRYKHDIVFVDGAYLLDISKNVRTEWEKVKKVIESLKEIAMKHRIPVVCTYQFNRAALSAEDGPNVEHIAYSDAIAQTAGAVVGIISPSTKKKDKKNEDNEVNNQKVKIFRILANRYGMTGEFLVNFDFDNMNFDVVEGQDLQIETYDEVDDVTDEDDEQQINQYQKAIKGVI